MINVTLKDGREFHLAHERRMWQREACHLKGLETTAHQLNTQRGGTGR